MTHILINSERSTTAHLAINGRTKTLPLHQPIALAALAEALAVEPGDVLSALTDGGYDFQTLGAAPSGDEVGGGTASGGLSAPPPPIEQVVSVFELPPEQAEDSQAQTDHQDAPIQDAEQEQPVPTPTVDLAVLDQSVAKLTAAIEDITDRGHLAALLEAEKNGKTRTGAYAAIEARIAALTPQE